MNRKNRNKKVSWKLAAVAALSALAAGSCAWATNDLFVKADEATTTTYVASVTVDGTTTNYETVDAAIAAITQDSAKESTITLLSNAGAEQETVSTPAGESTTFDLNGYTFSKAIYFYGNDEVKDSSENGTGTVTSCIIAKENALLRVSGGNYHSESQYPLSLYENATAIVSGGSFWGKNGIDICIRSGGTLKLKNAEFPTDGIWVADFDNVNSLSKVLDPSAKYYGADGTTEVSPEGYSSYSEDILYVKQEYIATFAQGDTTEKIATAEALGNKLGTATNVDVAATVTLYADIAEDVGVTQKLTDLTLDLNGNRLTKQGTHRVESGAKLLIKDGLGYGLYGGESGLVTLALNDTNAETGGELTLQCDTKDVSIHINKNSLLTVNSACHTKMHITYRDLSARAALNGGSYEGDFSINLNQIEGSLTDENRKLLLAVRSIQNNGTFSLSYLTFVDVLPENYMVLYADKTYETDLTKQEIKQAFSVVAHTHNLVVSSTDTEHWQTCVDDEKEGFVGCGMEINRGTHGFETYTYDDNGHSSECSAEFCSWTDSGAHDLSAVNGSHEEADGAYVHTLACDTCNYTTTEACSVGIKYDTDDHWTAYACGEQIGEKTGHSLELAKDENGHAYECTGCDYAEQEGTHDLSAVSGSHKVEGETYVHTAVCDACGYTTTADCTFTSTTTPSTETAMGYDTHTCDGCGYSYQDNYFCNHVGATYTQIYDGEKHTLTHSMTCNVPDCGYTTTADCRIERYPVVTPEGETYIWVGCTACDYGVKENYVCLHTNATYTQILDENEEETGTHKMVCDVCNTTVESEACVPVGKGAEPNSDGVTTVTFCYCGYVVESVYECYHNEYTVEQIYDGEKATWTHEYVCKNENCNEKTWIEDCKISYATEAVNDDGTLYYEIWYCVICKYEDKGEGVTCSVNSTYTQIYEEDGVTATGTHKATCTEGCIGHGVVDDCKFNYKAVYSEDGALLGYFYVCEYCGYSYEAEALAADEVVWINGVGLTLAKPYYVNGENGAAGTTYAEAPETWNAKLEAGDYEDYYVLTLNGLNVTTNGNVAFAIEYIKNLEIVLTEGSQNVLTVAEPEYAFDYGCYGGIGPKNSSALDLDMSGKGSLTVTVGDETPNAFDLYERYAIGIYSDDDSYFKDVILNITIGTSYSSKGVSIDDNFEAINVTFAITVDSNGEYAYGIEGEDDTEFYDCTIDIEIGGKVWYAYGIDSDDYLMVFEGCEVTIAIDCAAGYVYGIQSGDGGDEQASFVIKESLIDITLGDADYYMVGIKADDDDDNYFDMEITDSEISVKTGDVTGYDGELYGIWGSLGAQIFRDNIITIELGDCLYGGISGIVPEWDVGDADDETLIEDCEISIVTGDAGEWNIGIEASAAMFTIKNSRITIALGDVSLDLEGFVCALDGCEDFTVTDSILDLTVGKGYYAYAIITREDGLVIKNSEIDIVVGNGVEIGGIYAYEYSGEREALTVKSSTVNIKYGMGYYVASGIYAEIDFPDAYYRYGALVVEDSTVYVESTMRTYEDVMNAEEVEAYRYMGESNSAIYVVFEDYYAGFDEIVRIENSDVTALAGYAQFSAGIAIRAYSAEGGYVDQLLYIENSSVRAEGAISVVSMGISVNSSGIESQFGIYSKDSDVTANSGPGIYVNFGLYASLNAEYANLYVNGGSLSALAYDFYADQDMLKILLNVMNSGTSMIGGGVGVHTQYVYVEDAEVEMYGIMDGCSGYIEYDYTSSYAFVNEMYGMEGAFFHSEYGNYNYPYIKITEEMEAMPPVYVGGVALNIGEYYVNGEDGGTGKAYGREPENWNASLAYDEENDKYVLTLNGLCVTGQANSAWNSAIYSYMDLEIVLTEGSENVIVVPEAAANGKDVYAIEVYDYQTHEVITEYKGFLTGALTLTGEGRLTMAGALANTELVWDFETYVWKTAEENELVYSEVEPLALEGEETYLTLGYHVHEKGELIKDETYHWYQCVGCNEKLEYATHTAGEWSVDQAATCTGAGEQHKECTLCGKTLETEEIAAKGHAYDSVTYIWSADYAVCVATSICATDGSHVETEIATATSVTTAATCTEDGKTVYTAIFENAAFATQTKEVTIPATGHSYGEWTVVKEATKESSGLREKVCAHCGDKIAEQIPEVEGLSVGAIVAISVGSTVGVGVIGFSLVWFVIKKKKWSDLFHR